jgi:hypothetical protein
MKIRKLNSRGFSHIEAFMLVIVVVAIVGIGFFVVNKNKSTKQVAHAGSNTFFLSKTLPGVTNILARYGDFIYAETGGNGKMDSAPGLSIYNIYGSRAVNGIKGFNNSYWVGSGSQGVTTYSPYYFDSVKNILYVSTPDGLSPYKTSLITAYQLYPNGALPQEIATLADLPSGSTITGITGQGNYIYASYYADNKDNPFNLSNSLMSFKLIPNNKSYIYQTLARTTVDPANYPTSENLSNCSSNCLSASGKFLYEGVNHVTPFSQTAPVGKVLAFDIADETKISFVASSKITLANIKVTGNSPIESLVAVGSDVYVGGEQGAIYRIQNNGSVLTQKGMYRSSIWPSQPATPYSVYSDVVSLSYNPMKGSLYALVNNMYFPKPNDFPVYGSVIYELGLPGKTSNSLNPISYKTFNNGNFVNLGSDQIGSSNPFVYLTDHTQTQLWGQN